MENLSDTEEIIPPTPEIQLNKFCSRIDKTSASKSNLSRKVFKTDHNSFKRKRILSPDFKKVKQKAKQVTLFNFLVRTDKSTDSNPSLNSLYSPVKINLSSKFEDATVSNNSKTDFVQIEAVGCDEVACPKTELCNVNKVQNDICDGIALLQSRSSIVNTCKDERCEVPVVQTVASIRIENETEMTSSQLKSFSVASKENIGDIVTVSQPKASVKSKDGKADRNGNEVDENKLCKVISVQPKPISAIKKGSMVRKITSVPSNSFYGACKDENEVISPHPKPFSITNKNAKEICNISVLEPKSLLPSKDKNEICKDISQPKPYSVINEQSEVCKITSLQPQSFSVTNNDENRVQDVISSKLCSNCDKEENEICDEVALLQLNSQKDNRIFSKTDKIKSSTLNSGVEDIRSSQMSVEEKLQDLDKTFSWVTDLDWENDKENLDENFDTSALDIIPSNHFIHSEMKEGSYVKFKVKGIQRINSKNEILLQVAPSDNLTDVKSCLLKGFWSDCNVGVGDTVHILKPFFNGTTIIDNDAGFLVTNPDFLMSSTAVVSTLFCMRKAVLNHILPQWSPGNNIMMIGSLIHDIFQKSVNSHASTYDEILKVVKLVMKKQENLIALCLQDMSESEIEEKIRKYIPNILYFIQKHCSFKGKNSFQDISITKVEDIEENVWCPKYGIKGKIDMTVKVHSPNQAQLKIMPLELKTGRPSFSAEHIGQVNLYSLMMEERSKEVSDGLLLYLRDKVEMKAITANHHSKRGLIQLRNELTSYVYKWVSSKSSNYEEIEQCHLPKPINNKRLCDKCPYLLPCTVYQKAFGEEKALENSHAMTKLIPLSTSHLSANQMEYFLHWSRLLMLENATTTEVKAFWTEDAKSREGKGMCLSFVFLNKSVPPRQEKSSEYFIHTFIRFPDNPVSSDLKNSCLKEGDYVAISNQNNPDEVAVAMGYIIAVHEQYIEVAIERNLDVLSRVKDLIFRIDKIVSNSAAACVRSNLMLLMLEESQASKLRKLIIDRETPNFLQALSKQIVLLGRPILKCLNKNQQKAVLKAIMAEDYFLIKGMPGTGKTSTIVALVRLLAKMNVSILLASYTHSAIDNILIKLKEHVEFVRIGPKYRIHPDILEYSFENLTKDCTSVDQFSTFMKEKKVVATTCLGINHAIFKLRKFDVCIVDEAGQINQIACLGPLFFAKKFILVGDDNQLPPLVLNPEARKRGMQESLFQRLQNASNCIELTMQYRMNREIMRLCNELTYNGALQCGSEAVSNAVFQLPVTPDLTGETKTPWLLSILDTDLLKSVMFLNTDQYKTDEKEKTKTDLEADLVILLLQFLLQCNVSGSDVGIIAPYRKQVDLIERKLKDLKLNEVEVNTVDQYQGRDKNIIIISCVRPSDSQPKPEKTGVILEDEKRLNVAITRAKTKLILIGSKTILCSYKPFRDLINCLKSGQILDIT